MNTPSDSPPESLNSEPVLPVVNTGNGMRRSLIPPLFGEGQRKFALALIGSLSASGLCAFHCLSGGEWVAAQGLILGLYKAANVIDKRLGGAG